MEMCDLEIFTFSYEVLEKVIIAAWIPSFYETPIFLALAKMNTIEP